MTHKKLNRLFVKSPLVGNSTIELEQHHVHYLKNVMRLKISDHLLVFNGKDGEWEVEINNLEKKSGTAIAIKRTKEQYNEPDVTLLFAPIKHGKIDFLAQKATELGVTALQPVFTKHTIASRVNTERLQSNAIEAAEQSERLTVPEILEPIDINKLISSWDSNKKLLLCDETGKGKPIKEALSESEKGTWAILIGPEGGFSKDELDMLYKLPYVVPASLGPRILKADTAAFAALTCWQEHLGDWQNLPSFEA